MHGRKRGRAKHPGPNADMRGGRGDMEVGAAQSNADVWVAGLALILLCNSGPGRVNPATHNFYHSPTAKFSNL